LAAIEKKSFNERVQTESSQVENFLILNGFIVTLLVLSFFVMRRAPKAPVKLELRDDDEIASDQAREAKPVPEKPQPKYRDPRLGPTGGPAAAGGGTPVGWNNYQPRGRKPSVEVLEPEADERALNVFFMWNGHSWDAFEVLGIPGGSSLETARAAFQRAAALADQETLPFLKAALEAISKTV
jgi:hypothetical protein